MATRGTRLLTVFGVTRTTSGSRRRTVGFAGLVVAIVASTGAAVLAADAPSASPSPVAPPTLSSITAGDEHTCLIREATVWCTGTNTSGQLGNGTTTRSIAFSPSLMSGATHVDAAGSTTCAVSTEAGVWCWGMVPVDIVNPDDTRSTIRTPSTSPAQVPLSDVRSVAVGGRHACALLGDDSVWCWGDNSRGQLGDGTTRSSATPVRAQLPAVTSLDAGPLHSCAVTTTSEVWCWGSNGFHRSGQRRGARTVVPAPVPGIRARAVSVGGAFSCAIATTRTVWCWGRNNFGQLGAKVGASRISPRRLPVRGALRIATGTEFACAITTSQSTLCWGRNRDGQLADGTNKYRSSPRRLVPPNEVGALSSLAAGASHACAITAVPGATWCWGNGVQGQLGDSSGTRRRRGVTVWSNGVQMTSIGSPDRAVIAAAGDIACDDQRRATYGDGALGAQCGDAATAALMETLGPDAVIALGDLQYENADTASFRAHYDLSWGRLRSRTYPVRGNHEYLTSGAAGYTEYFGAMSPSYWWTDAGGWRVIAVDSWCQGQLFAGCSAASAQTTWLRAQLQRARADGRCAAVVMHHPVTSSGRHGTPTVAPLWEAAVTEGADLVVTAHDHLYERFEPLGVDARPSPTGVRLFISGLGGAQSLPFTGTAEGSAVRWNDHHGVLMLTLTPGAYAWNFVSALDGSSVDSGSATCTP